MKDFFIIALLIAIGLLLFYISANVLSFGILYIYFTIYLEGIIYMIFGILIGIVGIIVIYYAIRRVWMLDRFITSILFDLRLLHMYTMHNEIFIASILDLINDFQEYSDTEVMFSSDEEFAKFLHEKVHKEILLKGKKDNE